MKTDKRNIVPTPLGESLVDALLGKFSFADYECTRSMEQALDDIAHHTVVGKASNKLEEELQTVAKVSG